MRLDATAGPTRPADPSGARASGTVCARPHHSVLANPRRNAGGERARRERRLRLETPRGASRAPIRAQAAPAPRRSTTFLMRAGEGSARRSLAGVRVRSKGRRHLQPLANLRRALARRTAIASSGCGDVNAGARAVKMPAFSRARSSPRCRPRRVRGSNPRSPPQGTPPATRARVVASNLPPRPTSRTRHSTLAREKMRKPRRVRKRKYAGTPRSFFSVAPPPEEPPEFADKRVLEMDAVDAQSLADVDEVRAE